MALAKYKGSRLDQINGTTHRRPAFRVVIYNPRLTTIQEVVRGVWKGLRLDVSKWCSSVVVQQNQAFEVSEDPVSSRASLVFEIDDVSGVVVGGTRIKIDQRLFRDGTPIQIFEGDRRIAQQDWIPVFTGIIRGNPGADTAARGRRRVAIQAFGRAQMFQRQSIVGLNWPYDTDLGAMAVDIAMIEMGLERDEIRFGEFGLQTKQKANAMVSIGKMQGLYEIMKHVGRKPYFDAEGFLVTHDTSLFKPPVFSVRPHMVVSIKRVQQLSQFINSAEVIGLDSAMTKVTTPSRQLAEVNATVGYFDNRYSEVVYYSEDKKRRAENTYAHTITGHASFLGGGVSWTEIDEFSGSLAIDTGYAPEVLGYISTALAILAILEYLIDLSLDSGGGFIPGLAQGGAAARFVIQITKAGLQLASQYIMTRIGRYRIAVYGVPYEYVHQELRAIATLSGVASADVYERKESMHWLSTNQLVQERAKQLLRREQVKSQTYEITCPSIPGLEVDDIIEVDAGGDFGFTVPARFYVTSIQRSYSRGPDNALMTIRGWHCQNQSTPTSRSAGVVTTSQVILNP